MSMFGRKSVKSKKRRTLLTLALTATTASADAAIGSVIANVLNKTSGSVVTMTGTAGSRFALNIAGQVIVGVNGLSTTGSPFTITLTETLAGAIGNPKVTNVQITVLPAGGVLTYSETFPTNGAGIAGSGTWVFWTMNNGAWGHDTSGIGVTGGRLDFHLTTAITKSYASVALPPLEVGATYKFVYDVESQNLGAHGSYLVFSNGQEWSGTFVGEDSHPPGTNLTGVEVSFVANATQMYLYCGSEETPAVDKHIYFDNFNLYKTSGAPGGGGGGGSGGGSALPATIFQSSQRPVSFAGRTGLRHKVVTSVPATISIQSGLDGAEFTWNATTSTLTHPTGAAGKQVTLRATPTGGGAAEDMIHTLDQRSAISSPSGQLTVMCWPTWTDNWPINSFDWSKADVYGIMSVYVDAKGKLLTTGSGYNRHWDFDLNDWAYTQDLLPYWGYPNTLPVQIADKVKAAGKRPALLFQGGGLWDYASIMMQDKTLRDQCVIDLLAEVDRVGALEIQFDLEKNAGGAVTDAEWNGLLDFVRQIKLARPALILAQAWAGQGVLYPVGAGGFDNRLSAYNSYMDYILWMTYIQFAFEDPSHWTYFNTPIRGALPTHHRMDLQYLLSEHDKIGNFIEKAVVGTGGFVTYSKGPTAPDQPAYGVTGSEDTTNGQYDRIFPGGFFNQSSNLHAHYDIERQATWAEVNPAVSGTGGYNLDGVTYLAYQRKKDWVDICEYLRSIGGLGQFFWQPCHSVRQQTFDDFYAAVSQVPTTATSRPVYGSGSIVYSQAFPTNGAVPSEVTAYADVGFWNGPNASLVSVVNNRLQIQTTVSPQKNYTTAIVNFSGLTVGHLYAVFFDVITDANSMLDAWVQDAANFAGNNLPGAMSIGPNQTLTNQMLKMWCVSANQAVIFANDVAGVNATASIDNIVLRDVTWDTLG
jgi:hypothetical protein